MMAKGSAQDTDQAFDQKSKPVLYLKKSFQRWTGQTPKQPSTGFHSPGGMKLELSSFEKVDGTSPPPVGGGAISDWPAARGLLVVLSTGNSSPFEMLFEMLESVSKTVSEVDWAALASVTLHILLGVVEGKSGMGSSSELAGLAKLLPEVNWALVLRTIADGCLFLRFDDGALFEVCAERSSLEDTIATGKTGLLSTTSCFTGPL